jgi:hypothetical protein
MSARLFSLAAAADALGLKKPALIRRMRDAGCFVEGTAPRQALVEEGVLVAEQRCFVLDNGVRKPYQVTLVTIQGLAWLDQRINGNSLRKVS